ncbi:MAG: transposase [Albidovulum sp.]|nr:transposase [Albidovulum sp.]MDE0531809.1 transposase [Albidovulum sp.]
MESYFWNLVTRNCEKGRKQFVYGLLCGFDACPVAVEVFSCNMSDPQTFSAQVENIRRRFGLEAPRVAMVGDRGMITSARIRDSLRPAGMGWISALFKAGVRRLIEDGRQRRKELLQATEAQLREIADAAARDGRTAA